MHPHPRPFHVPPGESRPGPGRGPVPSAGGRAQTAGPAIGLSLFLASSAACRTTPVPLDVLPATPSVAHAQAQAKSSGPSVGAAELAWLAANDRRLAETHLAPLLTATPIATEAALRAMQLRLTALDRVSAEKIVARLLSERPEAVESALALALLTDTVGLPRSPGLRAALKKRASDPTATHPELRLLARVLDFRLHKDRARPPKTFPEFLTTFQMRGPLAPASIGALGPWRSAPGTEGPRTYRGRPPATRPVPHEGPEIFPGFGHQAGVYELEGYFRVDQAHADRSLHLVFDLKRPTLIRIDDQVIDDPRRATASTPRKHFRVTLSAGWHRLTLVTVHARPSPATVALIDPSGAPSIAEQRAAAPTDFRPPRTPVDATRWSPVAESLADALATPDRALFARALAARLHLSAWFDDLDRAERWLSGLESKAPESAFVHGVLSRSFRRRRLATQEEAHLRAALAADPTHPGLLLRRAQVEARQRPEAAIELVQHAIRHAPASPIPYKQAFRLYRGEGWHAEARQALDAAVERGAGGVFVQEAIDYLERRLDLRAAARLKQRQAQHQNLLGRARLFERAGDWAKAHEALDALEAAGARPARLGPARLRIDLNRGAYDAAAETAESLLQADPTLPWAQRARLEAGVAQAQAARIRSAMAGLRATGDSALALEMHARDHPDHGAGAIPKPIAQRLESLLHFDPRPHLAPTEKGGPPRGQDPADRWARYNSVKVLDRVVDIVLPDGHVLSRQHAIVRLQSKDAANRAGEIKVPAGAHVHAVRSLKPDGRIVDADRHEGKDDLSFSGLEPGDAVERHWTELELPATPWGGYLRQFYFGGFTPTLRADFSVVVPHGQSVEIFRYHGAPAPEIWEHDNFTVYHWKAEDIRPIESEPFAPPPSEFVPFVIIARGVDAATARRANRLAEPPRAPASAIIEQLAAALGDAPAPDFIEAAYLWLADNISAGGEKDPFKALTLRRGRRDILMRALLEARGIRADVVLARSGNAARLASPYPHPTWFNAQLLRIEVPRDEPEPAAIWWAQLSESRTWLGRAPPRFRQGHYLDPRTGVPQPFREDEVAKWPLETHVRLEVDELGRARGELKLTLTGMFGAEIRRIHEATETTDFHRAVQGWLGGVLAGTRFGKIWVEAAATPRGPLVLRAEISMPGLFQRDHQHLVAEEFFSQAVALRAVGAPTLEAYLGLPRRETPLSLRGAEETLRVEVHMPRSVGAPKEWPRSFRRTTKFGEFEQRFEWKNHQAVLMRRHQLRPHRIAPDAYPDFQRVGQDVLERQRNRLIVPDGGGVQHAAQRP